MRDGGLWVAEESASLIERYELKYVIPADLIEPISRFASLYCSLDDHSREHPDHFYPVNSLYFDTLDYRFLKLRLWGVDRRFNMRLRSYGEGAEGPYFAEVKQKMPTYVKKHRARLEASEWPDFLLEQEGDSRDQHDTARRVFKRLAHAYAIEPKIFTCYERRAFVSEIDDYARLTMDINMRYRSQTVLDSRQPYSLCRDHRCVSYDVQGIYEDEPHYRGAVILELKATSGFVPIWMIELIRRYELKQVGFSKYAQSSLVNQLDNGWTYMSQDRTAAVHL